MITSDTPGAPVAPSQSPASTAHNAAQPSRRYRMIFGGALTIATLIALIVAYASSDFRPSGSSAIPSTWKQVYSADLTSVDDGAWNVTDSCRLDALGLDATGGDTTDAQCVFKPSAQSAVTRAGFYFEITLAPAANVNAFVRSVVSVGDVTNDNPSNGSVVNFTVGQDGSYTLCDNPCGASGGSIYLHGGLAAWHGNALIANTVAMKLSPDHSTLTVYVNGQEVATVSPQPGAQPVIAVGTTSGSEAVFTRAALYTGQ